MSAASERGIRRHRFSREVLRDVKACARLDNWHGPLEIAQHWLVVGLWTGLSLWAWGAIHAAAAAAVYLLAVFFIGGRQRGLAGLLHQAAHGTLMANRTAGRVLGTLLGGYPVLQSFTGYRASHLRDHHAHLGDPGRDPDYRQYQRYGLCGDNLGRAAVRRHLLTLAGPRATLSYVGYLVRDRIWNRDEDPRERTLRIAFLTAVAAAAVFSGGAWILAAYWLVPLVTTQVWIGTVSELMEHYPIIESAPRTDIYMSWNRDTRLLTRLLLGEKKGEGYHLVHHLFPYLPLWRLAEADRILARDPEYAALPRLSGVVPAISRIVTSLPEAARPLAGGAE